MHAHELLLWQRLFSFADHYHFGTLWFLRESLLKRDYPGYDQRSTRAGHPGLSINLRKVRGLQDTVRMLIGTSWPKGPSLVAKNVMPRQKADKVTYFNVMRPVAVSPKAFFNPRWQTPEVSRNDFKPRLTAAEEERLRQMLRL